MAKQLIVLGVLATLPTPLAVAQSASTCNTACINYLNNLGYLYRTFNTAVTAPGQQPLTPNLLSWMCDEYFGDINTCFTCSKNDGNYLNTQHDLDILTCWGFACYTRTQLGDQQAIACWNGLPSSLDACSIPPSHTSSSSVSSAASARPSIPALSSAVAPPASSTAVAINSATTSTSSSLSSDVTATSSAPGGVQTASASKSKAAQPEAAAFASARGTYAYRMSAPIGSTASAAAVTPSSLASRVGLDHRNCAWWALTLLISAIAWI